MIKFSLIRGLYLRTKRKILSNIDKIELSIPANNFAAVYPKSEIHYEVKKLKREGFRAGKHSILDFRRVRQH